MDVLIIVDMQEAAFNKSDKFDAEGVIQRINQLSNHVRGQGGKVVFIQHDGCDAEGLQPHTPGWALLSKLTKTVADKVIRKTTNDAFYRTGLDELLAELKPDRVVVAGWATDFCVDTTIRSAVNRDYSVVVAADGHTVSDRPHLSAAKVIEHHNWVWRNLIAPGTAVEVIAVTDLCQ